MMNCKYEFVIFPDVVQQWPIGYIDLSVHVRGELEIRADSPEIAKKLAIEMMRKMTPKGMEWQLYGGYCTYSSEIERVGNASKD